MNTEEVTEPLFSVPDSRFTALRFRMKMIMALLFSLIFKCISATLMILGLYQFFHSVAGGESEFISVIVKSVNTFVIALAIFELGIGVGKEYTVPDEGENIYHNIRRTITRFVGTVCIALVLEALIMIIKYSQLELAGNLYYPVGILLGGSALLVALGIFLKLTRGHTE
jgi:hypothetical protein